MKIMYGLIIVLLLSACENQSNALNIALRCDDVSEGRLSIKFHDENNDSYKEVYSADVKEICEQEELLQAPEYTAFQNVKFVRTFDDGSSYELLSTALDNIFPEQGDGIGSHSMILKVTNVPPYLENDVL